MKLRTILAAIALLTVGCRTHDPQHDSLTLWYDGIVGGICEMLVQSHAGGLDIMPSPVEAWPEGSVKGLKARGNVTVGCRWRNGQVCEVTLCSAADSPLLLCIPGREPVSVACCAGEERRLTFREIARI